MTCAASFLFLLCLVLVGRNGIGAGLRVGVCACRNPFARCPFSLSGGSSEKRKSVGLNVSAAELLVQNVRSAFFCTKPVG